MHIASRLSDCRLRPNCLREKKNLRPKERDVWFVTTKTLDPQVEMTIGKPPSR